jgi:glucose/arabinose dehydrogenase
VFDTDLMRYAAGWTGGFLDFSDANAGQEKGNNPPMAAGKQRFATKEAPGVGIDGKFSDTREHVKNETDRPIGPLPYDYAKYKGLYVNGDKVIFSYTVGGVDVLDMPGIIEPASAAIFTRTLQVAPSKQTLNFVLCEKEGDLMATVSEAKGVSIETVGTAFTVKVAPHGSEISFFAAIGHLVPEIQKINNKGGDLHALCKGGPAHWAQTIETQGTVGASDGPYTVDTITAPDKNPWNSWFRAGGFDFFADGTRAAVCTLSGDVWIVSGIDADLKKLTWKRFATGLYEPLGLKIVDDQIYVLGRDQITRLHDLNNDGEADFYENFCGKWNISPSYHAFSFDLWTDKDGNFYFANDMNQVELGLSGHGVIFKISKDGSKIEEIAHGLRAPNGMAIGPNGEIVCSDNQGFWMPASKINWVTPGAFLGFPGDPRKLSKTDPLQQYKVPDTYDPPLCWIPHDMIDKSSGGEAFITSDKWGPFKGGMVHTSYGHCTLFNVMTENVDGKMQGGTVRFPLTFPSGIMRARFNEKDGQLYVCGLKGWQTSGAKDTAFCRVRYTGKPVNMPYSIKTHPTGIDITFTQPLDEASAKDLENYSIEQWNYRYSAAYGSKDYKVSKPAEVGHDTVEVKYVNLSADKKTVSLSLAEVIPVMQMGIKLKVKTQDGAPINTEINYTITKVGK